jgi:hypothetical protein
MPAFLPRLPPPALAGAVLLPLYAQQDQHHPQQQEAAPLTGTTCHMMRRP